MARMLPPLGPSFRLVGLSVLGLSLFNLTGCVAQEKYNAQKLALDAANERLARADANERAARAEADAYRRQYEAVMANAGNQGGMVANLTAQNAELQRQLDELNRRYEEAVNRTAPVTVLTPELNEALNAFAMQNPDLVDFDSTRGIVKFKSDVTVPVGSAEITDRARAIFAGPGLPAPADLRGQCDVRLAKRKGCESGKSEFIGAARQSLCVAACGRYG